LPNHRHIYFKLTIRSCCENPDYIVWTMPTLTTCPAPSNEMPSLSLLCPLALTLSIGGVDFTLKPSNNDGVVSYRYDNQGKICLDLASFTGTLQVAAVTVTSLVNTNTSHSTVIDTTMVVDEPNSPDMQKDAPEVSPGQQRLSFGNKKVERSKPKAKTAIVLAANKETNGKKRGPIGTTASGNPALGKKTKTGTAPFARSKKTGLTTHSNPLPPFQHLRQSSYEETSSFTQDAHCADLSQTMDTTSNPSSCSISNEGVQDVPMANSIASGLIYQAPPKALESQKKSSVQEILDRVNSSDDSVATVRNDEDSHSVVESIDSDSTAGLHDAGRLSNDVGGESAISPKVDAPSTSAPLVTSERNATTATASSVEVDAFKGFPPPIARWGHTMTQVKGNRLLVYGGQSFDKDGSPVILSDVHVYDTVKQSWDKPINCKGEPRQWHSATFLPERQLLISFGGESLDAAKKNKVYTTDNLRVLDTDIMLWYPPAVSGDAPSGRSGHTATLLPNTNELVVFGGVKGSKWLNSVSILDTVRWIWSTPKILGSAPRPRSYHSTTVVKATGDSDWYKLVIFGGNNMNSCFSTVHVLEPEGKQWRWSHPSTTGQAPFPRTGHSAVLLDDGKTICIYGGWDPNEDAAGEDASSSDPNSAEDENIFKGSYLLDIETWAWRPGPKAVFGGSGSKDLTVDDCGDKRCGHAAVLEGGKVLVFGGRVPGERLAGDFQTLSPSEHLVGLDG
jgi:N-acetylneuraminic acid mutarotase